MKPWVRYCYKTQLVTIIVAEMLSTGGEGEFRLDKTIWVSDTESHARPSECRTLHNRNHTLHSRRWRRTRRPDVVPWWTDLEQRTWANADSLGSEQRTHHELEPSTDGPTLTADNDLRRCRPTKTTTDSVGIKPPGHAVYHRCEKRLNNNNKR